MSDDEKANAPTPTGKTIDPPEHDETEVIASSSERRDGFLIDIISLAMNGIELNVTLSVGGSIVSGRVISGQKYFSAIKAQVFGGEQALESGESNGVDLFFAPWLEAYDSDDLEIGYIHLEGARHYGFGGTPIPNNTGLYWRGKIDSVDGFSFGVLSVGD